MGIQTKLFLFHHKDIITFTARWANSADDKFIAFFLFFFSPQKMGFGISRKLSPLHEMSKPVFWEK